MRMCSVLSLLLTVTVVTLIGLIAYGVNHDPPSRLSGRERLLDANPWLRDLAWPDVVESTAAVATTVATTARVRSRLATAGVATLLYVGVAVDRRSVGDVPSWYDR